MSRPKTHYSVVVKNHVSGARLKVELIDLPFATERKFRVRVNGPAFANATAWQAVGAQGTGRQPARAGSSDGEQDDADQAAPRVVG